VTLDLKAIVKMSTANLERIPIVIATTMATSQWDIDLPIDVPVQALIARLVAAPELPFHEWDDRGVPIPYRMMWREGARYLMESETLREAQVQSGHTLVIAGEVRRSLEPAERLAEQIAQLQRALDIPAIATRLSENQQSSSQAVPIAEHVFVVHGRDDSRKFELTRLLDRALIDAEAIVLHEQPNRGATILEKLERNAQKASYAVVLLTGDDEGRLRDDDNDGWRRRGRQNVIFELGIFIGLLGRSRVAVLKDPDIEEPSDLSGLVYIALDTAGAWRYSLLKEISDAGIAVNFGRIP